MNPIEKYILAGREKVIADRRQADLARALEEQEAERQRQELRANALRACAGVVPGALKDYLTRDPESSTWQFDFILTLPECEAIRFRVRLNSQEDVTFRLPGRPSLVHAGDRPSWIYIDNDQENEFTDLELAIGYANEHWQMNQEFRRQIDEAKGELCEHGLVKDDCLICTHNL